MEATGCTWRLWVVALDSAVCRVFDPSYTLPCGVMIWAPGGGGIVTGGPLEPSYVAPGGGGMVDPGPVEVERGWVGDVSSIPPGALATPSIGSSVVVGHAGKPAKAIGFALVGVGTSPRVLALMVLLSPWRGLFPMFPCEGVALFACSSSWSSSALSPSIGLVRAAMGLLRTRISFRMRILMP